MNRNVVHSILPSRLFMADVSELCNYFCLLYLRVCCVRLMIKGNI